jgi:REP element-mobilizing transposase RayT
VTICAHSQECLFGEIIDGEMRLNAYGEVVEEEWLRSAEIRSEIELDAFVVMPNHLHGIVIIMDHIHLQSDPMVGAHGRAPLRREPRSLGSFIAGFKSAVTKRINSLRGTPGAPVWQRNYYEHIIRDEHDLACIREYIATNPLRWDQDTENPIHKERDDLDRWLKRQVRRYTHRGTTRSIHEEG